MRELDLTGKRFGKLTVLKKSDRDIVGRIHWLCQCDCGEKTCVRAGALTSRNTRSCGCGKRGASPLAGDEAGFRLVYGHYLYGAKKRKHVFELSPAQFRNISIQPCHYCGVSPKEFRWYVGASGIPFVGNGIDRLNNAVGYTESNCVPCCKICNNMKRVMSKEEFLSAVKRIADFQNMISDVNGTNDVTTQYIDGATTS